MPISDGPSCLEHQEGHPIDVEPEELVHASHVPAHVLVVPHHTGPVGAEPLVHLHPDVP